MKVSPFEFTVALLSDWNTKQSREDTKILMDVLSQHPRNPEEIEQIAMWAQCLALTITSPEFIAWLKNKKINRGSIDALVNEIDKRMLESKTNFKDESEKIAYRFKIMRDIIREKT
jgi:hypothetical protein